jgi:RNA-binding protein
VIRKNSSSSRKSPKRSTNTPKPAPGPARAPKVAARKQPSSVRADTKPAPTLTPQRRRQLRAQAHPLDPIVQVGHGGVSDAVVHAVSRALADHELIKVRLHEPEDKRTMAELLAQQTRSALCGLVGHTVILFRPKPKSPTVSGVARSAIKRNQLKPKRGGRGR